MKIITTSLLLILFFNLRSCDSQHHKQGITNDMENDIRRIIPAGEYSFYLLKPERKEDAVNTVKEKDNFYIDNDGEIKPLDKSQSFDKIFEEDKTDADIELKQKGIVKYKISHDDSIIRFESMENKLLPPILMNLKANIVTLNGENLSFKDSIKVTDADNGLRSEWSGYQWQLESLKDDIKNTDGSTIKRYRFTIGKLKKNKKIYVEIKAYKSTGGLKVTDLHFQLLTR